MEDSKKNERKHKRFAARLKSSKGIICTNKEGPNLILCNAGQATGLDKNTVYKLVSKLYSNIEAPKIIAQKGETYSFLVFSSTEDSLLFYKAYNGKARPEDNGTPLCISFVESVPNSELICYHENPNGLTLLENFISEEEEKSFINAFDWIEENESNNLKNRQVKHYGYKFRYGRNDIDLSSPLTEKIPKECDVLWNRLIEYGFSLGKPDQLTINKYAPGQGIPSHVDKHSPFGDTILSLSLGSSVVMDWRHRSGKHVPVLVRARSMLIMQNESRYDWQHGIQSRTWDPVIIERISTHEGHEKLVKVITSDTTERQTRISLTFRWTRSGPCNCIYKTLCDSATNNSDDIEDNVASTLEELHVHQVYEQIAGHFSTTRHKPWPKVVEFMEEVPAGALLLDLGCGNGKNILRRNDVFQIAGERSNGLLLECQSHLRDVSSVDCVRLDALHVPLVDGSVDVVLCIAVLHHFSTKTRRLQAISTIARLLRIGGRALITVWAKDQTKSNYLSKNKTQILNGEHRVTVSGVNLPVHENRTQFQHNDVLVPWKLRKVKENRTLSSESEDTLLRYYHVFEDGELDSLCRQLNLEVEKSFYEEGNWCVVCKRIKDAS